MFDSCYPHKLLRSYKDYNSESIKTYVYQVKSSRTQIEYFVNLEEFPFDVFAIKFHLKSDNKAKEKYKMKSNANEAKTIFRTCVNILIEHHKLNRMSTYVVVGSNSLEELSIENTQRYRIYKYMLTNFICHVEFEHFKFEKQSIYLVLNRNHPDRQSVQDTVQHYMERLL